MSVRACLRVWGGIGRWVDHGGDAGMMIMKGNRRGKGRISGSGGSIIGGRGRRREGGRGSRGKPDG